MTPFFCPFSAQENRGFALYRVDPPYHPVTNHGKGKKLGGGKGSISHYTTPVKAGRVILEIGGNILWDEVEPWLRLLTKKLPFDAICVTQDMLERIEAEEKRLIETNENPYTFEWFIRNNMMDCKSWLSPRDQLYFGKFVYRDRTLNKKWNLVRRKKYHRGY